MTSEQRLIKENEEDKERGEGSSLQAQGLKHADVQGQNALDVFKEEKGGQCGWNRQSEGKSGRKPSRPEGHNPGHVSLLGHGEHLGSILM